MLVSVRSIKKFHGSASVWHNGSLMIIIKRLKGMYICTQRGGDRQTARRTDGKNEKKVNKKRSSD